TTEEAYQAYADANGGKDPAGLDQVMAFFGGPVHKIASEHLNGYEALGIGWITSNWKGDFHIPGVGAGNVRVGREMGQQFDPTGHAVAVDKFMMLVDCNLIDQ